MGSLLGSRGTKGSNWQQSSSTPGFTDQLGNVLNTIMTGYSPYNKAAAQADMTGALATQASDALQKVMPSIAKQNIQAGMYNSTTKTLMQNDAEARIQAQLANNVAENIARYAGIESNMINSFANASQAGRVTQSEGSGSQSGGGSGIMGFFADGGEVPESDQSSGIGTQVLGAVMQLLSQDLNSANKATGGAGANLLKQLFPDNIFDTTAKRREQEAGITINVGPGSKE